jgi:uncharacterized membrane protein YoaT (DUF817 family)
MDIATSLKPIPKSFRALAVGAVTHAAVVLAFWLIEFVAHVHVIPGRWWLTLALLWLIWPVLLALHPARTAMRVTVVLGIAVALLLPCASTIYTFSAWAIQGFAP